MEAAEAKIQKVLEGNRQFLVPHFQRPYSWREDQWRTLWTDVLDLIEDPNAEPHFLGPIVTAPARSIPEGVEKRLLIDGQQRLTTVLVLLALVRDQARSTGRTKLADRAQDLLTNRHEDGNDHFKLLPTQGEDPNESDREAFLRIVLGSELRPSQSAVQSAADFFGGRLRRPDGPELEALFRVLTQRLTLVSIILAEKDNPHRIFESLNGKGRPLSQADLIRNYFFMRLPESEHERVYVDLWRPMQRRLGEDTLTDFVRHYLSRRGTLVRETDVYARLRESVESEPTISPREHLKELARYSEYYAVLREPSGAPSSAVGERLTRLNRLEVTVAYPFLLSIYAGFAEGRVSEAQTCAVLDVVESYIVRRFVAGVSTQGLNKIFAPLHEHVRGAADLVEATKHALAARGCPRDSVFRQRLGVTRLYGSGERQRKTRLILERLETARGHKERLDPTVLSIEHVMPQSLTEAWKSELGETFEEDHEELLHTLGNLTLTSYNSELSNLPFAEKKRFFSASHVELNRYFDSVDRWTGKEIERRAEVLAELAVAIWPYFGPSEDDDPEPTQLEARSVTGTVPTAVRTKTRTVVVQSWTEVAVATMEGIIALGEDEFARAAAELPRTLNFDLGSFRRSSRPRRLSNGAHVETNLSASAIYRLCVQATAAAGLGPDDWEVTFEAVGKREPEDVGAPSESPTPIKQLQLDFWTALKPALAATGRFPRLRAPRPQYWYDVGLGRTNVQMTFTANFAEHRLGVRISLGGEAAELLDGFQRDREDIERIIGAPLDWNPYPDKKIKTIRLTREFRLIDPESWADARAWAVKTAVAFRSAFDPRIAAIDTES